MTNETKIALLKMEIVKAENGVFVTEMRVRASKKVGNEQAAKEHEANLAELMGVIEFYKEQIAGFEVQK
jgi:hypothetical protein